MSIVKTDLLAVFFAVLIGTGMGMVDQADAKVVGACSNCHSMHNSQDGASVMHMGDASNPVGWNGSGQLTGPTLTSPGWNLKVSNCVGCHTSTTNETIITVNGTRIPIVNNLIAPTYPPTGSSSSVLAGGNFYWVATSGGNPTGANDNKGHNVGGISAQDTMFQGKPWGTYNAPGEPGTGCNGCHNGLDVSGTNCKGCHVPRHHADDSAEVVGRTGGWYRFLGSVMQWVEDPTTGVMGIEEDDWERSPASNLHNGYLGTSTAYSHLSGQYMTTSTIGEKCAGCHSNFHSQMNSDMVNLSGNWLRHPTDVVLPNEGEYANYTVYNPLAPVAKQSLAGKRNYSGVDRGSDVVTCISCHRPHGSPYPDMLRWNFEQDCKTSTPNPNCGCFVCHSLKDD